MPLNIPSITSLTAAVSNLLFVLRQYLHCSSYAQGAIAIHPQEMDRYAQPSVIQDLFDRVIFSTTPVSSHCTNVVTRFNVVCLCPLTSVFSYAIFHIYFVYSCK